MSLEIYLMIETNHCFSIVINTHLCNVLLVSVVLEIGIRYHPYIYMRRYKSYQNLCTIFLYLKFFCKQYLSIQSIHLPLAITLWNYQYIRVHNIPSQFIKVIAIYIIGIKQLYITDDRDRYLFFYIFMYLPLFYYFIYLPIVMYLFTSNDR